MKFKNNEKRDFYIKSKTEIRSLENGQTEFIGFVPYESRSEFMGFFEIVKPGCFTKTIQESDIRCLFDHDKAKVLGRSKSGTLKFEDTTEGLYFYCPISERSYSKDLVDLISSGDVDGVSFRFVPIKDNWIQDEFGNEIRELIEVKLIEFSFGVAFPAYPNSGSSTRSIDEENKINFADLYKIYLRNDNSQIEEGEKRELEKAINFFSSTINPESNETEETRENDQADEDHLISENKEPVNPTLLKRKFSLL